MSIFGQTAVMDWLAMLSVDPADVPVVARLHGLARAMTTQEIIVAETWR